MGVPPKDPIEQLERVAEIGREAIGDGELALPDLRDIANLLLFSLWETDPDPARPPWPGGEEEERSLRLILCAETSA